MGIPPPRDSKKNKIRVSQHFRHDKTFFYYWSGQNFNQILQLCYYFTHKICYPSPLEEFFIYTTELGYYFWIFSMVRFNFGSFGPFSVHFGNIWSFSIFFLGVEFITWWFHYEIVQKKICSTKMAEEALGVVPRLQLSLGREQRWHYFLVRWMATFHLAILFDLSWATFGQIQSFLVSFTPICLSADLSVSLSFVSSACFIAWNVYLLVSPFVSLAC